MQTVNLKLLSRYFSSKCTEKERSKVEAWINASAENKKLFERLEHVWELSSRTKNDWDFTRPIQKLSTMLRESEAASQRSGGFRLYRMPAKPSTTFISIKPIFQIAAAIVALLSTIYAVQYLKGKALEKMAQEKSRSFAIEEASTKPGQQVTFRFVDGTKVVLNSASRLRYSNDPEGSRDVYLEGEAYFDVVHSDDHPFVVHANDQTVRDVGTKFDVNAWSDDDNMKVAVVEGIVSIQSKTKSEKSILVYHDQYCVVNSSGVILPPTKIDVSNEIDWMNGKLVFRDAPMSEVIKRIWRRYGIRCLVADTAILSKKITTSFDKQDPAKRVLDMIALSLNLTYKMSEDSVLFESPKTFSRNGSARVPARDLRERRDKEQINTIEDTLNEKGGYYH